MGNMKAINSFSKIKPIEKLNENFTLAECTVCACGKNRNFSYISKETMQNKLYGLSYLPIVAHLIEKEDGSGVFVGGHDYELTDDMKLKPLTQIVGCVIADSFEFRTIEEFGQNVEYVVCKCILYTEHVPELMEAVYDENTWFSESMEIDVIDGRPLEEDSNYYEILDFNFLKLCLLGLSDDPEYNTKPCFISSKVCPAEFSLDSTQMDQMMEKMKCVCSMYFDIHSEKGGSKGMTNERIDEILASYSLTRDALTFEITDDMTEEVFIQNINASAAHTDEPAEASNQPHTFSSTYEQKKRSIIEALDTMCVYEDTENGRHGEYYSFVDFDESYVYAIRVIYSNQSEEKALERYGYTIDENNVVSFDGSVEPMFEMFLTKAEMDKIDADRAEVAALREFKESRLEADRRAEYDAALSEFADLEGVDGFDTISNDRYSYESVDVLREKCYALRGKHTAPVKKDFSMQKSPLASAPVRTSPIEVKSEIDEFIERYGKR